MRAEEIQTTALEYIRKSLAQSKNGDLTEDTELIGSGTLDSVAMVELVVWVEGKYKFRVDIEDLTPEAFGTVRKIADYIHRHTSQ